VYLIRRIFNLLLDSFLAVSYLKKIAKLSQRTTTRTKGKKISLSSVTKTIPTKNKTQSLGADTFTCMHEIRKLFSRKERNALTPKYKQISNGD